MGRAMQGVTVGIPHLTHALPVCDTVYRPDPVEEPQKARRVREIVLRRGRKDDTPG